MAQQQAEGPEQAAQQPQQAAQNPALQAVPVRNGAETMPVAPVITREPSGNTWVGRYPTQRGTESLDPSWRQSAEDFISALEAAGAAVHISETARNPDKVYLMHYAYRIAQEGMDPETVPAREGVNIDWVHRDADGNVDLDASRAAAQSMVDGYNIVHRPSLTSRHIDGLAVDMSIAWTGTLTIANGNGENVVIATEPRNGAGNTNLHAVGASYGVHKLAGDAPHWSSDGR
jgi:hypothetical protein